MHEPASLLHQSARATKFSDREDADVRGSTLFHGLLASTERTRSAAPVYGRGSIRAADGVPDSVYKHACVLIRSTPFGLTSFTTSRGRALLRRQYLGELLVLLQGDLTLRQPLF